MAIDDRTLLAEIEKYTIALAADPKSRAFAPLAEAYRKSGKIEEALKVVLDGLKIHPNLPGALVTWARCLLAKGLPEEARPQLEKAVKMSPENLAALSALGDVQEKLGDPAGAAKSFRTVLLLSPADPHAKDRLTALTAGGATPAAAEKGRAEAFEVKSASEALGRPAPATPAAAGAATPVPAAMRPPAPVPPRPPVPSAPVVGSPPSAGTAPPPRPLAPTAPAAPTAPRPVASAPVSPAGPARPASVAPVPPVPPGMPPRPAPSVAPVARPAAPPVGLPPRPAAVPGATPVSGVRPAAPPGMPPRPMAAAGAPPVAPARPAAAPPVSPAAPPSAAGIAPRAAAPVATGTAAPSPAVPSAPAAPPAFVGAPPRVAATPPSAPVARPPAATTPAAARPAQAGVFPAVGARVSAPVTAPVAAPVAAPAPVSAPFSAPVPAPVSAPVAAPAPAPSAPRPPAPLASDAAWGEEPAPLEAAPIQTATMADLFVKQGHPEQAIPIYENLLAADPANAAVRQKLVDARSPKPSASLGVVPELPRVPEETTEPPLRDAPPLSWDAPASFGEPEPEPASIAPVVARAAAAAPIADDPRAVLENTLRAVQANRRTPGPHAAFRGNS